MSSTTWTAVVAWITGDAITAARFNGQYGDNLTFLRHSVPTQTFRNLRIRTHTDADKAANQIALYAADEITMSDGARYSGLTLPLTADITTTGAGGLDTGARAASSWYEVHVIGKSSTMAVSDLRLMLHLAASTPVDTSFTTTADANLALRKATSTTTDRLAQGVQFANAGPLMFVDVVLARAGSVVGNVWFSIQASSAGDASGTPLATSAKMDASKIATGTGGLIRFMFRNPFTVVAGTQYHLVLEGDYTRSDSVNIVWTGVAAGGYAGGVARQFNGTTWSNASGVGDFVFKANLLRNSTALTLPSGYDQSCKLTYAYNNSGNVLTPFVAHNKLTRWMTLNFVGTTSSTVPAALDATFALPPVPCLFTAALGGTIAGASIWVGGVPDGYDAVGTTVDGAGQEAGLFRLVDASGASGTFMGIPPVPTEAQLIYGQVSTGTGHFSIVNFEW